MGMVTEFTLLPLNSANNLCCEHDLPRDPLGAWDTCNKY